MRPPPEPAEGPCAPAGTLPIRAQAVRCHACPPGAAGLRPAVVLASPAAGGQPSWRGTPRPAMLDGKAGPAARREGRAMKILVAGWDSGGGVEAVTTVVRRAAARGHDLRVLGTEGLRPMFEQAGARF